MTDLMVIAQRNALQVFNDKTKLDPFLDKIRQAAAEFKPDLETADGRKEIASMAHKISKIKVYLDGVRKELVRDWKDKSKLVDISGKYVREELDNLRIMTRKPLTDWEDDQAEKARIEAERIELERIARERDSDHEIALLLNDKFDRDKKEALRIEAEAEKAKIEAKRIEREEMKERIAEQARIAAEVEVERERQKKIEAERRAIQAEERAKVQNEEAEKRAIEAKIQAESEKISAIQAEKDRITEIKKRSEEEKEKLEANKRHVGKIMKEAKISLISELQITEECAKNIVLAIRKKLITNVSLNY